MEWEGAGEMRERERERVRACICPCGSTLHIPSGRAGGADHVVVSAARLKRQRRDKKGSSALRDSLGEIISEPSLLPCPLFFLRTEQASSILLGPQEEFRSDSRRPPLSKDTGSF